VQAYDGTIYITDEALYLRSAKTELGIKDPYELNEAKYKAVLELLRQQQPQIHRYWHDATVQMSDVKNDGVVASSSWGY
ncbi:spermidine/putrescine ABC transporter substrate-binding protein, partial [Pseudomonas sp. SIMBA_064]